MKWCDVILSASWNFAIVVVTHTAHIHVSIHAFSGVSVLGYTLDKFTPTDNRRVAT